MPNRAASEAAVAAGVRACTDVTGFSLGGHLWEMVRASGVDVALDLGRVPLLPGARGFAAAGLSPGGTERNREFVAPHCHGLDRLDPADVALLFDPQTSGGLLMAVSPIAVDDLIERLAAVGVKATAIGMFIAAGDEPGIRVS